MTRKEAINIWVLPALKRTWNDKKCKEILEALEQEPMLDKIRAEVEELPKTYPFINHIDSYVKEDDVKKIINKYRESEE